jgi:hypothetical protein
MERLEREDLDETEPRSNRSFNRDERRVDTARNGKCRLRFTRCSQAPHSIVDPIQRDNVDADEATVALEEGSVAFFRRIHGRYFAFPRKPSPQLNTESSIRSDRHQAGTMLMSSGTFSGRISAT